MILKLMFLCAIQVALFRATSGGAINIPRVFEDSLLYPGERDGQEIAHLGKMIKLDTRWPPAKINELSTRFSIYTRNNQKENLKFTPSLYCTRITCHGPFQYDLDELIASGFDPKRKTIIMISGYLTKDTIDWADRTKDIWLKIEDVNVIVVTWKDGNHYIYDYAVANTPLVARQITIFLHYLSEIHGLSLRDQEFLKRIHFIGHSLGSHIAGFVGQDLGGKMGRITALDPAGPSFEDVPRNRKLDRKDAILVDVIHTNAGVMNYNKAFLTGILRVFEKTLNSIPVLGEKIGNSSLGSKNFAESDTAWFGIDQQVGDIDYYANNGKVQPGCEDALHICDHGRSHEIYEDLLKYHYELMQKPTTNQSLKNNRLLAFKSVDFKDFLSGNSFNKYNCKTLTNNKNLDNNLRSCSIPFDLVTPVDELIEELKHDYNLDLYDDDVYYPDMKFYFKTHPKSPLLADHHLLRIHLNREQTYWDESCMLKTRLRMSNGLKSSVDLNRYMELVESEDFYGVAIPFVAINNVEAREALNQLILSPLVSSFRNGTELSQQTADLVYTVLPAWVQLQVVSQRMSSKFKVPFNLDQKKPFCRLGIHQVEVEPITNEPKKIIGLYSSVNIGFNPYKIQLASLNKKKDFGSNLQTDRIYESLDDRYREFSFQSLLVDNK